MTKEDQREIQRKLRVLEHAERSGQVSKTCRYFGIGRASFVGNSMGGAVSLAIAARAPERVDRLIAIDAAAYAFDPSQRPPLLRFVGPFGGLLDALPVQRRLTGLGLSQVFADRSKVTAERLDEYVVPLSRPGARAAIRTPRTRSASPTRRATAPRPIRPRPRPGSRPPAPTATRAAPSTWASSTSAG